MAFEHVSVMLKEAVQLLNVHSDGVYIDGTLGGGGHSEAILEALKGHGILYGIDRDIAAIESASVRLSRFPGFEPIHGNFHDIQSIMAERSVYTVDGILIDLGVSSYQLDTAERGFSYHQDAPLDMRMDQDQELTAEIIVNEWTESEIASILWEYGEEKWSKRIAQIIVERRKNARIQTTADLVACVDAAIPKAVRRKDSGHSARRTFQALRIAVNDELEPLKETLRTMVKMLNPGGRLVVLTFHSLEDRIVKQTMRDLANPCICPKQAPICICGRTPQIEVFKSISPSQQEIEDNKRAHSARLRACERLDVKWNLDEVHAQISRWSEGQRNRR